MASTNKILIVDDEPLLKSVILQKFKNQIKNNELIFVFASNGVEALQKLSEDPEIGIVFTDINMPEMDGLVLLSNLVNQNRIFRTVVVSAYNDLSNIRAAMNRGASDFITKPVNLNDLEITLTKTIEQYHLTREGIDAQKRVLEFQNELNIARNIQQTFIPHNFKPFPNNHSFELFGEMIPAREIGGDFFDFFTLDANHLGIIIADVSGKGVPAALYMAMSRALIRATSLTTASPKDCIRQVNHLLCGESDSSMFVTAFYAVFNINTGQLTYCNAGHNPPYIISEDGNLDQIGKAEGIALGVVDDYDKETSQYIENTVTLKKHDCFVLYTDGITEANNKKNDFYGEERLENFLKVSSTKSLNDMIKDLHLDIKKFIEGAEQSDDLTILCLRYNGQ